MGLSIVSNIRNPRANYVLQCTACELPELTVAAVL